MTTEQRIGVGSPAPDFALKSQDGEEIRLSDVLREKTAVLVFYIFDFSGA